jgi:hypothetical protein
MQGVLLIGIEEASDDILIICRALEIVGLMKTLKFLLAIVQVCHGLYIKEKSGNLILVLKVSQMMTCLSVWVVLNIDRD